jgi:exodeoxyribonuclease V beta subunit
LLDAFPGGEADRDVLWVKADQSGASKARTGFEKTPRQTVTPVGEAFEPLSYKGSYEQRRIKIDSFSSLHQKMSRIDDAGEEDLSFQTEQRRKEDDEGFASLGEGAVSGEKDLDEVPGGIDAGLMFHDILEHMDYGVVLKAITKTRDPHLSMMHDGDTREIILRHMETHGVDDKWKDSVCRILGNTLTASVASIADNFILAHLQEDDRLHEVEFYYSFPPGVIKPHGIPDCEISNSFIRGFVDLVFRKDGKYYIADWKSNTLETGYGLESMGKSMDHADYHLQYKLYAVAVLRWLKQTMGNQFDPERDFGGVFYFYLRGMGMGEGAGIYHVPPHELGSLEQLEGQVAKILRN